MRPDELKLNNRPKHINQDNSIYFFSIRTIDGQWFLRSNDYKQILLGKIREKAKKYNFSLIAYAILNNHYHMMVKVLDSKKVARFIGEINGSSAKAINEADYSADRKIWWNYFDYIIRNDTDFYKHLNYIHQNPIKHGLVKNFDFTFSSYNAWVAKKGREYLDHSFEKYPIIDFVVKNDEF